ncbi:MAG: hypothetical protein V3T88_02825 [Nitrosomonadaceae bacterium]
MIIDLEKFEVLVTNEGMTTLRGSEFFRELVRAVNLNTPLTGTGSPEGVLTAEPTQRYMDTAGASEAVLYIKQTGTGNTGWILG